MICGAEACKLGAMIHGAEVRVHFLKSFQKWSTCENLSQKGLKNKKSRKGAAQGRPHLQCHVIAHSSGLLPYLYICAWYLSACEYVISVCVVSCGKLSYFVCVCVCMSLIMYMCMCVVLVYCAVMSICCHVPAVHVSTRIGVLWNNMDIYVVWSYFLLFKRTNYVLADG
jgi:hypothetical protein